MTEIHKKSAEEIKGILVIILIVANAISMFLGNIEIAIVIFAAIILKYILGKVRHLKAEQYLNCMRVSIVILIICAFTFGLNIYRGYVFIDSFIFAVALAVVSIPEALSSKYKVSFILSGNSASIIAVVYASLAALPIPFAPVHLLFINLLTDNLPAIALELGPHKVGVMKKKPWDINSSILRKSFGIEIFIEGFLIAACTMIAFRIGLFYDGTKVASTMAFATLALSRLVHGFNCKDKESIFKIGIFTHKYLWSTFILGLVLLNIVLLVKPLGGIFQVQPLSAHNLQIIYGLSVVPFILIQIYKLIFIKAE